MGKGSGSGGRSGEPFTVSTISPPAQHQHHPGHKRKQPQPHDTIRFRPKGLTNVGNTCYANAVLQCLLSTALTQALMDPKAAPVFRQYSFNLQILQQGSGSVDSQEGDVLCDDSSNNKNNTTASRKDPTSHASASCDPKTRDPELHDRCMWLTNELKFVTMQYVHEEIKKDPTLADSVSQLFFKPEAPVVNPEKITRHPHRLSRCLRPYQQEDAHEFLRALLGTLGMNGRNRELHSLFDGLLESSITCQSCDKPSVKRDRYMDLSLDIADNHIDTLQDALEQYTKQETLTGDNKVFCTRCNEKCEATKGLRLATAPSILVCHLKRFTFNPYSGMTRLSKKVKFPMHLDISDYMSNLNQARPPAYELVAVLVHQGQYCEAGHYVAFVKSEGNWYCCNDKDVKQVPVEKVMRQQAYMLMYEVADMREKHGYSSPSGSPHGSVNADPHQRRKNSFSFLNTMLCGMDDSLVNNVCCVMTSNIPHTPPSKFSKSSSSLHRRARDDVDLESQASHLSSHDDADHAEDRRPLERPKMRKSNSIAHMNHYQEQVSSSAQRGRVPIPRPAPVRTRCFSGNDTADIHDSNTRHRPPLQPSSCRSDGTVRPKRSKSVGGRRLPPRYRRSMSTTRIPLAS